MTLKDQSILADGDINEGNVLLLLLFGFTYYYYLFPLTFYNSSKQTKNLEADMLENIEIGEQKQRNEAYKAAQKKGTYEDK